MPIEILMPALSQNWQLLMRSSSYITNRKGGFMRIHVLPYVLAASLLASPVYAKPIRMPNSNCMDGVPLGVNISIRFDMRAESFTDAKKKFDDKMAQVKNIAKQQNIDLKIQTISYNFNLQPLHEKDMPQDSPYQLNVNATYTLDSPDSAFKLGEILAKEKFEVSINAFPIMNGVCMNNQVEDAAPTAATAKPSSIEEKAQ